MQHGNHLALQERSVRGTARFVLLTDLPTRAARGGAVRVPQRVMWSLISANNRSIGWGPTLFATMEEAVDATQELTRHIDRGVSAVSFTSADPARQSFWKWTVSFGERPVAVAAFRYKRRLECEDSARRFLATVPIASPASPAVFRIGSRISSVSA
jgi:hypothetical protein